MRTGTPRSLALVLRALLVAATLALSGVTSCAASPGGGAASPSGIAGGSRLHIEPQVGHSADIDLVTFSSTGAYLLTGSPDRTVILWDAATGAQLRTIVLPGDAEAVAATMTDDARWALVLTNRGGALVVDLLQGTKREVKPPGAQPGVLARALPGSHAAVTVDRGGAVRAWDLDSATVARQGSIGQDVALAAMSQGSHALLTVAKSSTLSLFDLSSMTVRRSWQGRDAAYLALSADETTAFTITVPGEVIPWDVATGSARPSYPLPLQAHSRVRDAAFSADARRLVVLSPEEIQLVDVATGKREARVPWGRDAGVVALDPSGRRVIVTLSVGLHVWDTTNADGDTARLDRMISGVHDIAVSTGGGRALWTTNDRHFYAWDGATAGLLPVGQTRLLGTTAVCSHAPCFVNGDGDGVVEIRDLATGAVQRTIPGDGYAARVLVLSPDDRTAWAARGHGGIAQIDLVQGSVVRVLPTTGTVGAMELSPDGRELHVASGASVEVWDATDGHPVRRIPDPTSSASDVSVSPDGGLVAITTTPAVRLVDRTSGRDRSVLGDLQSAGPVAWLPDGRSLLVGGQDGTVRRWDVATSRAVQSFEGLQAPVEDVHVLAGATHAMAIANGVVRVWNLATGASLGATAGGSEWLVYTDDGLFDGSPLGGDLAVAVDGVTPQSIEGLTARNDRPDLLLEHVGLGSPDTIARFRRLHEERLRALGMTEAPGPAAARPNVQLEHFEVDDKNVDVALRVTGTAPLASYRMLVNDVPVPDAFDVALKGREQRVVERLELSAGDNRISFQVFDQTGAASVPWTRELSYPQPAKGTLYYLGFGVGHYHDAQLAPGSGDKDVLDVGAVVDQMGRSFDGVQARTWVDDQVTADAVRKSRDFLKTAKVDDTVVVFVSGQGTTAGGACRVFTSATQPSASPTATIPLSAFRDILSSSSARKQLLWVDACEHKVTAMGPNAGSTPTAAAPESQASPRMIDVDLARASGSFVLLGARPSEASYEEGEPRHGAFATALLAALTTSAADANHDTRITTDELARFVEKSVAESTAQQQHPVIDADNRRVRVALPTLAAGGREYDDRRLAGAPDLPVYQPPTVAPETFKHSPVFFHPGSVGALRPLIKERDEAMRLSDGTSYLAWSMSQFSFLPNGKAASATTIPTHNLLHVAASQGAKRAALIQGYGPLTVVDLPSLGVAWKRDGDTTGECGAVFAGDGTLYFHDRGRHSRLWRADLGARTAQAFGPLINADECWGSNDGKTFVVRDDTAKIGGVYALDTASGRATTLTPGPVDQPVASPDGSRVCYFEKKPFVVQKYRLVCVRVADRGVEVLSEPVNDFYHAHFDPSGRHLFFVRSDSKDGVKYFNVFSVADFANKTVVDLQNVEQPLGGDYRLLDDGSGIAFGAFSGMRVYDLTTRTVSWLPGKNLFTMMPIAGRHSVIVGQEYRSSMHDLFIVDLAGQAP